MSAFHRFYKSFYFASKGIYIAFKGALNIKIHLMAAIITLLFAFLFQLDMMEWIAVLICIGMVFSAEIFNTAIEKLVDHVSPAWHARAGSIKDMAAGAVLIVSFIAMIVGLLIFIPKILQRLP
ncbi:MAG: diacylglycerol kinase family protein [Microbacter sp.]